MALEVLSDEDFDLWIPIPVAINRCGPKWELEVAAREIWKRLEAGLLRAAAGSSLDSAGNISSRIIVPVMWWRLEVALSRPDFWLTGSREIWKSSRDNTHFVSLFNVRIDPAGFETLIPQEPKLADLAPSKRPTKPLPRSEIARFAELYLGIWKHEAIEGPAFAAIRACYPDHTIGRDPFLDKFRELRGPGKRGKPPIRGK